MAQYYPIMLNIVGCKCVLVGGGVVAARKAEGLLEAGAQVVVISPQLQERLQQLRQQGSIQVREREYREEDLMGATLIFAATDNPELNGCIARRARNLGIPVNIADSGASSSFIVPSVIKRGRLKIAVSTAGASPALASSIRSELEQRYGEEYDRFTSWLERLRKRAGQLVADTELRHEILRHSIRMPASNWIADAEEALLDMQIAQIKQGIERSGLELWSKEQ